LDLFSLHWYSFSLYISNLVIFTRYNYDMIERKIQFGDGGYIDNERTRTTY